MSGMGGIYPDSGGESLHGDGRPVARESGNAPPTLDAGVLVDIANGIAETLQRLPVAGRKFVTELLKIRFCPRCWRNVAHDETCDCEAQ